MAYFRRAETYKKLGKTREAISDYIMFLETDHRQPDMAEDFDDALKEAFKIAKRGWEQDRVKEEIISFGIPVLLDELIEEYEPQRELSYEQFFKLALSWLKKRPEGNGRYIGFVQLMKGKYDEAIKEFNKSIEECPGDPDVYYLKGVSYISKRKKEKGKSGIFKEKVKEEEIDQRARESFEEAIKIDQSLRLCLDCGYRTSLYSNFCIYCGRSLLYAHGD